MDRAALEQQLQETQKRITEGERRIIAQWNIIEQLERDGHNAGAAKELLSMLLAMHEKYLEIRERLIKLLEAEEPQTPEGLS